METTVIEIKYSEIVTMRLIEKKSVQEVADHYGITWEEAVDAIRSYGFKVGKDEKKPAPKPKGYRVELVTKEEIVETKKEAPKNEEPPKVEVKKENTALV